MCSLHALDSVGEFGCSKLCEGGLGVLSRKKNDFDEPIATWYAEVELQLVLQQAAILRKSVGVVALSCFLALSNGLGYGVFAVPQLQRTAQF